ncbi:MAG: hypothetical protein BRD50_00650 [Bacteroidetes bacterium SW_11_45_7]|nr:MAG: hypothetical protein BRD50_00650 [Bacteroidetes bacterium SW_11_45_7]
MRQLITFLLVSVCSIGLLQAQIPDNAEKISTQQWNQIRSQVDHSNSNSSNQSLKQPPVASFPLDYDSLDSRAAQNQTGVEYQRFAWNLQNGYQNDDNLTLDWGAQVYDSLVDYTSTPPASYQLQDYSVRVDSVLLFLRHQNISGNNDTVVFSIWETNTVGISGQPPNQELTGDVYWRDSIITSQSISPQQFGGIIIPVDTLMPAQGQSFTFRVDVYGDTVNTFQVIAGSATSCVDSCGSRPSVIQSQFGANSLYYVNLTIQGQNLSGINSVVFPGPPTCPNSCTNFSVQNFAYRPYVTLIQNQIQVNPVANPDTACPGETVQLNANDQFADGSVVYSWSSSVGSQLSDPTVSNPTAKITSGTNTFQVTAVDNNGNGDTATASVTVVGENGITVSIDSANNTTLTNDTVGLTCGGSVDLIASPGNTTTGATYQWMGGNNPPTSVIYSGISVPDMYSVEVENQFGCTAKDTVVVAIEGVNQNVSFTNPQPCAGDQIQFTNTSSSQSGWSFDWEFGDGSSTSGTNPTHTYSSAGTYQVKVTADSAGCMAAKTDSLEVIGNSVSFNVPSAVCPGDQFNLTNTSSNTSNWNFTWTFGDNSGPQTGTNISHTYSSGGSYEIELQATKSGCAYNATDSVTVPNDPNVDFTAPDSVLEGNSVSFTNTSGTLSGWTFTWDFGDGNSTQGNNATHTYSDNATGLQTVTLTAENMGCTFETQKNIFVKDVVGIADRGFDNDLTVFPNPTTGGLTVDIQNAEYNNLDIAVYNLQGEAVYSEQVNKTDGQVQLQLDLSDLSNGMYLLKLQSSDKIATQKITLNK